jgi:peptide/nickel transport system ATP-binding protein
LIAIRQPATEPLLRVSGLSVEIPGREALVRPVREVSFELARGGTLAMVGESGSGKTMTCLALVRLLTRPARVSGGQAWFDGIDLLREAEPRLRRLRGRRIGFIFQDPNTALDPVFTIGAQICGVMVAHLGVRAGAARARAVELMQELEIPRAGSRFDDYPHQFSGGMKQRIAIAVALAGEPELLIADEPTTALDVTTESNILGLIARLQRDRHLALLLVTHSLGVAAQVADHLLVMYAGRIVERGPAAGVLESPGHPYTEGLVASALSMEEGRRGADGRLATIRGTVPSVLDDPDRCQFAERCPYAAEVCWQSRPPLIAAGGGEAACHFPDRERRAEW